MNICDHCNKSENIFKQFLIILFEYSYGLWCLFKIILAFFNLFLLLNKFKNLQCQTCLPLLAIESSYTILYELIMTAYISTYFLLMYLLSCHESLSRCCARYHPPALVNQFLRKHVAASHWGDVVVSRGLKTAKCRRVYLAALTKARVNVQARAGAYTNTWPRFQDYRSIMVTLLHSEVSNSSRVWGNQLKSTAQQ